MLLRFIVQNFESFKDAVEFNTFPSSKSHSHEHHKNVCGHAMSLRMSAIYGANGAGKSNLLGAIRMLKNLIQSESLRNVEFIDDMYFRLSPECTNEPSGLAIEFYRNGNVFYYHVEFKKETVMMEELLLSKKTKDVEIFFRENGKIRINGDLAKGINSQFVDALDRLVRPDMLLLSLLGKYYPSEFPLAFEAYKWFTDNLQVVIPNAATFVPHLFEQDAEFAQLINSTMPELNTGITKLKVKKEMVSDEEIQNNSSLLSVIKSAKSQPGVPFNLKNALDEEVVNIVYENGVTYKERLVAIHKTADGSEIEMSLRMESDGTRRLIEYMPLFYAITKGNGVFVVDEIERSIHPIMIKDIVRKISESKMASGQLIFTTHESGLLDQSIFRPDEIWFAQKDTEQATQLYPLSDYNIHKTANIENGYLNGRYGGIPFLSNLKDLHW